MILPAPSRPRLLKTVTCRSRQHPHLAMYLWTAATNCSLTKGLPASNAEFFMTSST